VGCINVVRFKKYCSSSNRCMTYVAVIYTAVPADPNSEGGFSTNRPPPQSTLVTPNSTSMSRVRLTQGPSAARPVPRVSRTLIWKVRALGTHASHTRKPASHQRVTRAKEWELEDAIQRVEEPTIAHVTTVDLKVGCVRYERAE
jgi:hypothetical protein